MLKQKLFKRTALGIYQIEISLIPNVNGSIIKTDYGLHSQTTMDQRMALIKNMNL